MHDITEAEIRTTDVSELRYRYNLDYIISENQLNPKPISEKKIAVIAHVNYFKLIDYCFNYIENIPQYIDIYITTKGEENIHVITEKIKKLNRSNIKIVVPEDRGREISALLVACKDYLMQYDYLCFVHDKKKNKGEPYISVGQSFCDLLWENTLKSSLYIQNVINVLESEEKLGLLSPPSPYESFFFTIGLFPWCDSYRKTSYLAEKLKLNCVLSNEKQPFILGTTFWCKTDALKPLFESGLKYEDFVAEPMPEDNTISHGIERILPYVAQSQGYYSGIMMTEEYASLYKSNYKYMLKKILNDIVLNQRTNNICSFEDTFKKDGDFEKFVNDSEYVYIYGAGNIGQRCLKKIRSLFPSKKCAFIVSNRNNLNGINGCNVFEIEEIDNLSSISIIVAMKLEYILQVLPVLKEINVNKIYIFAEEYI